MWYSLCIQKNQEVIVMKVMIASDIHGSAVWCKRLMDAYRAENPERLVLLGDILYLSLIHI